MLVQAEVIAMLAEERGVPASKLTPASRLLEDLGMDGDDAVEFFDQFERRFSPNLESLHYHWRRHFGPESWGWSDYRANLALWLGVMTSLVGLAGVKPLWSLPTGVFLIVGASLFGWRTEQESRPHIPVTVGDLIEAALTKRWPLAYGLS